MKRRALLQFLISGIAALAARIGLHAQAAPLTNDDTSRLRVVANVVLPQEIGDAGQARSVASFVTWVREYRASAETDHGYGFPRLRRTPPSPASRYREQLDALDAAARHRGQRLVDLSIDEQRAIIHTAITAARVERLPSRPDGGHVATDLITFFFGSVEANDLCYRARIGRDTCRSLAGSEDRPAPAPTGAR